MNRLELKGNGKKLVLDQVEGAVKLTIASEKAVSTYTLESNELDSVKEFMNGQKGSSLKQSVYEELNPYESRVLNYIVKRELSTNVYDLTLEVLAPDVHLSFNDTVDVVSALESKGLIKFSEEVPFNESESKTYIYTTDKSLSKD